MDTKQMTTIIAALMTAQYQRQHGAQPPHPEMVERDAAEEAELGDESAWVRMVSRYYAAGRNLADTHITPCALADELAGRVVMPVSATAAEIAEMRASIAEAVRLGYEAAVREAQTAA